MAGCEKEAPLSDQSIVDLGAVKREQTELDKWILETFTLPYGIEVEYRWDRNVAAKWKLDLSAQNSQCKKCAQNYQNIMDCPLHLS